MKRIIVVFATITIAAMFSSCYKKLYLGCMEDKTNLLKQNDQLGDANKNALASNTVLTRANDTLSQLTATLHAENDLVKTENVNLRNQIIEQAKKTKKFDLYFRQLCCDGTTEKGADEVYITVLATKIGSGDVYMRAPGDNNHWDMNDGNQPTDNPTGDSHCLTNRAIFSNELKPGETYFLNVAVCEEDGGTTRLYQQIASQAMQKVPVPFVATAGQVLGALTTLGGFITDKDDWMGMFGVKITNDDGTLIVEWRAKDGVVHLIADPSFPADPLKREIRMNHDGSNYVGWFSVRY